MVGNGLITLFGGLLLVAALAKAGTSHGSWLCLVVVAQGAAGRRFVDCPFKAARL